MRALVGLVRFGEALNGLVGRAAAWLTLATVLICAAVVGLRYAFGIGHIWMQELYVWTHAAAFMLGAGYTFMMNKHVRVDVVYERRSPRTRAWLDLVSTVLFLFPWVAVLTWFAWPYVIASWEIWETSSQVGGMPGLYVMKTIILVFAALMLLQGLVVMARSALVISGNADLVPPLPTTDVDH
jgi:TRAP-type mannitol/chloroaromatic compound transport system permease small subunit